MVASSMPSSSQGPSQGLQHVGHLGGLDHLEASEPLHL
uniref:Uncharacterized protein n=1 Tax=Arundo donax TaxID=35708 RepID=A0A0A8Z6H2_ARUDO